MTKSAAKGEQNSAMAKSSAAPAQPLANVQVGDFVWIENYGWTARGKEVTHSRIAEITKKDAKGRLYIVRPESAAASDWRYGFKPETGTAQGYGSSVMRYATPEEISTYQREKEEERQKIEAQEREEARRDRLNAAAPALYEALSAAQKAFQNDTFTYRQIEALEKIDAALALADAAQGEK